MPEGKRVLVICRISAGNGTRAREALDIALAFGAFDQPVTLLFTGDGVCNLRAGQSGDATHGMERLLGALPDYGIQPLFADAHALAARGIQRAQMVPGCELIGSDAIAALIAANDLVFSA